MSVSKRLIGGQGGATMTEFAIAIPVFLSLVIALLYVGLGFTAQGVLDHAAARALSVAVTMPELSERQNDCSDDGSTMFCQGIARVQQEAIRVIESSFIRTNGDSVAMVFMTLSQTNPEVLVPTPAAGQTVSQALQTSPIVVKIRASMNWFLPGLASFPITRVSSGYYEVRSALSFPIPVDCNGFPKNSPNYWALPCDCSEFENAIWNSTTRSCELCQFDRSNTQSWQNDWTDQTVSACYCPSSAYCRQTYGPGAEAWYAGPNRCKCGCNMSTGGWQSMVLSGTSNTACVCGADPWDYPSSNAPVKHHFNGKVAQGDLCVCDPPITLATCQAIFPGLPVAPAAGVACDCRCTNNCVNAGRDTTTGNWFTVAPDSWWDPHHGCNCSCWNVFPGANWVQAPNRTYVPGVGCPCNNTCAAGKQPDPDSLDCSCVCVPQDCGPNALQNSDSCACQCRFGGTWPGGCNSAPSGG